MSILDQHRVLKLNKGWVAIETISVEEAFKAMCKETHKALHIEYPHLENGEIDFSSPCTLLPVRWKDWITLPVRSFDCKVKTASGDVRVPTVLVTDSYDKIPTKYPRYSKHAVWVRDGGRCQITGEKLTRSTGNIDHWNPQAKGGETSFNNCLLLSKKLNSKKGDMTMEEFCKKYGFKLPKRPERPKFRMLSLQNTYNIKDWDMFLEE